MARRLNVLTAFTGQKSMRNHTLGAHLQRGGPERGEQAHGRLARLHEVAVLDQRQQHQERHHRDVLRGGRAPQAEQRAVWVTES